MMFRRLLLSATLIGFVAFTAAAQTRTPQPAKARTAPSAEQIPPPAPTPPPAAGQRGQIPPPGPPPPPRKGQPINVKVDVTITDQRGGAAPIKKTVSLIVSDQQTGMIRAESLIPAIGTVPLHVDATPELLPDGKVRLRFGINYDLPGSEGIKEGGDRVAKTSIRENLALVLDSGKPLLVTQSADPVGDRQVTVEVKATVMK